MLMFLSLYVLMLYFSFSLAAYKNKQRDVGSSGEAHLMFCMHDEVKFYAGVL